jgi:Rrf2 family protein
MKRNSKISVALHALVHLTKRNEPITSQVLGECLNTNPVVIRRVLGELKALDIVSSVKGHGGGWLVTKDPKTITLYDVYDSLNERLLPSPFKLEDDDNCKVMNAIAGTMDDLLEEATKLLTKKLKKVSLEDIVKKI